MRNSISGAVGRLALASTPVLALALIAMQPAHAQTFTALYTFEGGADGGTPLATPLLNNGNICGTTAAAARTLTNRLRTELRASAITRRCWCSPASRWR